MGKRVKNTPADAPATGRSALHRSKDNKVGLPGEPGRHVRPERSEPNYGTLRMTAALNSMMGSPNRNLGRQW